MRASGHGLKIKSSLAQNALLEMLKRRLGEYSYLYPGLSFLYGQGSITRTVFGKVSTACHTLATPPSPKNKQSELATLPMITDYFFLNCTNPPRDVIGQKHIQSTFNYTCVNPHEDMKRERAAFRPSLNGIRSRPTTNSVLEQSRCEL